MAGPLIIAADLGESDLAWLDGQRRAYFPPERNRLAAHLTMFHALPPSLDDDLRRHLKSHTVRPRPDAILSGLMNLGGGVAYRVASPDLDTIRDAIAEHFHGALTAQDARGWRAHITIQNKVRSSAAKELHERLSQTFQPRPLVIKGLALHRYLGGPWETIGSWPFRG